MSVAKHLAQQFRHCPGWEQRYRLLLQMGRDLPSLTTTERQQQYLVHGCESRVWLLVNREADNSVTIRADSDGRIVKGLLALIVAVCQDQTTQQIEQFDFAHWLLQLGLDKHLSASRRQGLGEVIAELKRQLQTI